MSVLQAQGLVKQFGDVRALDGVDINVERGRIVGLIGPNGSGKTTALQAILGLQQIDSGDISVMGYNPWAERAAMMTQVAYIADTGILPKWMKVRDLLSYVEGVHPNFDRKLAEDRLSRTQVRLDKKVNVLSKGMNVQLHLAIILAIGAEFLVLDEPTLGLDILYRQQFYDGVLNDYFTQERSILVTTHEVREIEHILTDVVLIHQGRVRLATSMEEIASRFAKVVCTSDQPLPGTPLFSRQGINGHEHIFSGHDPKQLELLGDVSVPNLAELFMALVGGDQQEVLA
ncbi:MAG: ABC transporter ATP-binding protein [Pseudomonadota bacterium]